MGNRPAGTLIKCLFILCLLCCGRVSFAQTNPTTDPGSLNRPVKDTSKTNTAQWRDDKENVYYKKLNSDRIYVPDTTLHTFHRPVFTEPWYRDMGNLGSPVSNMLFTPENRVGPTLGYHVFDVYRFDIDSVKYYATNRPYSVFSYQLGSKLEQIASIMHTQDIKPNWNIAVEYRKTSSPGFYKLQRNNHDNAMLSTNYKSLDKHYTLYAAMVYNKEQHDENGGVITDTQLTSPIFNDKKTVNVAYDNTAYSILRSPVSNLQRDFTFQLLHSYVWGNTDTTYNEDSTAYTYKLKPLFSISHKMQVSSERHMFKDLSPDSFRYAPLFAHSFINNGTTPYYIQGEDSVVTQQNWFWVDNQVLLNGFIGKEGKQLRFSAGVGNRFDQFVAKPVANVVKDSLPNLVYTTGYERNTLISNYLTGNIIKEALHPGEWEYEANTRLYVTGPDAGDLTLDAHIGKELKNILGSIEAGFQQQVNSTPYAYQSYENQYTKIAYPSFDKESVTMLYASIESPRFKLGAGIRTYLVDNYIYLNQQETPTQYTVPFNVTQLWLHKSLRVGVFLLDNDLVYQKVPENAPINIPALMGKHQFSYEHPMFKKRLKIAVGVEMRYNSAYHPAGYDAILNRFYYQNSIYVINIPQAAVFVNFKVKRFRAFIMGDNLQQLIFNQNTILYTGTPMLNFNNNIPKYAGAEFYYPLRILLAISELIS